MPAAAPENQAILLAGGLVVDPGSADAPRRQDILIQGDRIVAMQPRLVAPRGARRIDIGGQYVVPGLWDMHAHLAAVGPVGDALEDYVQHGVLGIRDMGGRLDELLELRNNVALGLEPGPSMFIAGPTLNGEASGEHHRLVRNAQEGEAAVRDLRARGVDFIKVHRRTSREAFLAILAEAQRQGVWVAGHVPLAVNWTEAADKGLRSAEHVQGLLESEVRPGADPVAATFEAMERLEGARGDEIISALVRNGTFWTPTLIYYEQSWSADPPARRELKQRIYARLLPLVLKAHRAGVRLLAGTDLFERRGEGLHDELDRLVRAGLTPRDALAAATTHPFSLMARGPGPIRVGNEASMLIVRADPLRDIGSLRCLSLVVLRGTIRPPAACVDRQRS